jgi:hypothetical protein
MGWWIAHVGFYLGMRIIASGSKLRVFDSRDALVNEEDPSSGLARRER